MNRSVLAVVAVILLFVGTADAQSGQCTLSSRNVRASDACNTQTETYLGPKDAPSFGGVCMSVTPSGCKLSATTTADKSCPKGWVYVGANSPAGLGGHCVSLQRDGQTIPLTAKAVTSGEAGVCGPTAAYAGPNSTGLGGTCLSASR